MKKRIDNIKKQWKTEAGNSLMIGIGYLAGYLASKGVDKAIEKYPDHSKLLKGLRPVVLGVTGYLLSAATDKDEKAKLIGYGLIAAATGEGIKLIPISGFGGLGEDIDNQNELRSPQQYYMEKNLDLEGFGLNALPIKEVNVENAAPAKMDLPDLDGNMNGTPIGSLAYSASYTEQADNIRGII